MWIIQGCYLLVDANSNQIHLHYFLLEKVLGFQTDLHVISLPEGIVVKCWGTSVLMRQPWEEAINRWSGHNCIRQRSMVLKKILIEGINDLGHVLGNTLSPASSVGASDQSREVKTLLEPGLGCSNTKEIMIVVSEIERYIITANTNFQLAK